MRILQMGRLGSGHLPVAFAIIFTFMLGITYVTSVWRGDVDPVFPYISASGDTRPESCVFSMLLNLCSFLSLLVCYLRYSLVVELNRGSDAILEKMNEVTLYFGALGAFGMFIVANFQETALIYIHLFGAILCFGTGVLFMAGTAACSYRMHPIFSNQRIAHVRAAMAAVGVVLFFTSLVCGIWAGRVFHSVFPDLPTPRPWSRKLVPMPGYELHCVSALAEWLLACLNMCFILSFSREFEKIRVQLGVQPLVSHLDQSPLWHSINDLSAVS